MTSSLYPSFQWRPLLWFGLLAALLVTVEYLVAHRVDFSLRPALASAVAFDLLLVLPGLFYGCVVRRYRLPVSTMAAAFGAGLALIQWLLPPAVGLSWLVWAGRLGGALEVLTVGYTVVRLRRVVHAYQTARQQSADVLNNLQAATEPVLGRLAGTVTTEIAVFYYAVLGAWAQPEVQPGEVPFSTYRRSGFGALLATFGGLMVLETTAIHLVVAHWHPMAAWVLTGLSGYSLLWLLAHGQAVRCRPVLVAGPRLVVRIGLFWQVSLLKAQVIGVENITDVPAPAPDLLNLAKALLTPPNLLLTLAEPQVVRGPYGLRRTVRRLALYVDEPAALAQHWG